MPSGSSCIVHGRDGERARVSHYAASKADVRKKGADAVKDSHKVDVEHPSPIVEPDVVNAAAAGDTGILANHMDIAECLVGRPGRMLDADRIGNITANAAEIRPKIAQAFDGGS
jgi:hypothetical protein